MLGSGESSSVVSTRPDTPVAPSLSFETFFRAEIRSVVALAYALSGSHWAAEDIAQDAFVTAQSRWEEIRLYDQPGAWVRRIAVNMAVSHVRRKVAEAKALLRLAARAERVVDPIDAADIDFWRAVRSLPRRQAQVVALRYVEDLSMKEIAVILECAEGTVKAHLNKARATLAKRLGLEEPP